MSQLPDQIGSVACYLRRSREDLEAEKRGEDTLLAQRELIEKNILPRYHIGDYDLFEEVVSGESIKDRPVFRKLLSKIRDGKYKAIVVKDLYRLGRGNYSDMGTVTDLIIDKHIYIITRDNVLDPHNHDDLRNIRFSMFLSREEYEAIVWRLVNGKYDKVRNRGAWVAGSTPFGYDYDRQTRKLVPNEDSTTVKMIFDWFVNDNFGYGTIGTKLRKLQIMTPRGKEYWNPMQIRRILENPVYIGTVRFRLTKRQKSDGKVVERPVEDHIYYENAHEPIIDQITWNSAQNRLQKPRPKVNVDFSPTELASLVVCSDCGRKMIRQVSTQHYHHRTGEGKSIYRKSYLACLRCHHYVKYDDVEKQIIAFLNSMAELDEELLIETFSKMIPDQEGYDLNNALERAKDKLEILSNRLKNLKNKWLDEKINDEEYEADRNEIQQEIKETEESIRYIQDQIKTPKKNTFEADIDILKEKIRTVISVYRTLADKTKKNTLLTAIFESIELVFLGKQGRSNAFDLNVTLKMDFLED